MALVSGAFSSAVRTRVTACCTAASPVPAFSAMSSVGAYFLVCSGRSAPHVKTIAEAIREELKTDGVRPMHAEGQAESGWVLLDYGDVLMHVFLEDTRAYYALERLWGDAPSLSVSSVEDGA